jgi:tetrahydromethanopterin S-methyltransferase subunit A
MGYMVFKQPPHPDYPTEEGRYLRGNDYSPVAVVIILNTDEDKIPPEIERLVRTGIESGASLSGIVQTANIGIEKIVCNIVANPNIRYIVLGGPESAGHRTGDAIRSLLKNGINERKQIIGTEALTASLFNISQEMIDRFRDQITLVDCQHQNETVIRQAVWACYQETPTEFNSYSLYDPGAYPEVPMSGKITWNVTQPWSEPKDEKEREAKQRALDLMEKVKEAVKKKREDKASKGAKI